MDSLQYDEKGKGGYGQGLAEFMCKMKEAKRLHYCRWVPAVPLFILGPY